MTPEYCNREIGSGDSKVKNCWVLDTCCISATSKASPTPDLIRDLHAADGVHFAKTGYENLAVNILNVSNSLREKVSAPSM
jgi:hypothetical protein